MNTKYERLLAQKRNELTLAQSMLSRNSINLKMLEQIFRDSKKSNRDTWFCNLRRRAAQNAHLAYKEWHMLWARKFELGKEIVQLQKDVNKYEKKVAQAKKYNERRRKRRAEKKQVSQ